MIAQFIAAVIQAPPHELAVALLYVLGNVGLIGISEWLNKRSHK